MSVEVGQEAPDFEVRNQHGKPVRLSSFRGHKNVVLVFYPKAFTPTCTGELCSIRDERPAFEDEDTVVLRHLVRQRRDVRVPTPSRRTSSSTCCRTGWPHGEVARAYGVFIEERGFALRGTFIIDKAGVVRWSVVNSPADARRTSDYREALAAL